MVASNDDGGDGHRVSYVGKKIRRVRWRPLDGSAVGQFAGGSWDDQQNTVSLWQVPDQSQGTGGDSFNSTRFGSMMDILNEPILLAEVPLSSPQEPKYALGGDVAAMEFMDPFKMVVGTSKGEVRVCSVDGHWEQCQLRWSALCTQANNVPCTSLAVSGRRCVAADEAGTLRLFDVDAGDMDVFNTAGQSASFTDVTFQSNDVFIAVGAQMQVFDRRVSRKCILELEDRGSDGVVLQSVAIHNTVRHLLATGGSDGLVSMWDLRNNGSPVGPYMNVHDGDIWEIKFHPTQPYQIITCSEDGSVTVGDFAGGSEASYNEDIISAYGAAKDIGRIQFTKLIDGEVTGVNSIDVLPHHNTVLAALDSESVYVI